MSGRDELQDGEGGKPQTGRLGKEAGRRALGYLLIKGGLTAPGFLEKRHQALLTTVTPVASAEPGVASVLSDRWLS